MSLIDTWELYRVERIQLDETNDCGVRALAAACDMSYFNAHTYCRDVMHRVNRRGMWYLKHFDAQGLPFKLKSMVLYKPFHWEKKEGFVEDFDSDGVTKKGLHISKFLKRHPKGRFIIVTSRHFFAVVDGVIYGNKDDCRRFIKASYELVPREGEDCVQVP